MNDRHDRGHQAAVTANVAARLVLIGPMAAGKSTLGRKAARILDAPFIDTDRVIAEEHGPIAGLFDTFGEAHFRMLERDAVGQALRQPAVISLGGGAVLNPDTRAELADVPVVFLTVSPDVAAHRLRGSVRPLARGGIDGWSRILSERLPLYEELSEVTFDTSIRSLVAIVQDIAEWVREQESQSAVPREQTVHTVQKEKP